ncbi:RNA polymerase sigma-70 factor (ECF subfamily) [Actinomadura coerulea]|uniref:RNA polymerase sigma-70 factor (ECF subfamily) n=1 Tax=Actinomadura coerulea TaxID=46159 RepID=A0A7X0L2F3_9ACTN|nr:RNA polymerase sigma factor [Actinomadura coerulea]MBB6399199.1 RNA polymerase sigma-70 factor (ECF subfamily) [Actinomadura coerulea]GGQ24078.1 DNA-directed RNA polymerase sigma-70 factor [Actinomadura coerulea]
MSTASEEDADDASVIRRSRQEPEAFALVFRRYAPDIKRYVIRRLGADAAEDVVAETFLAAFRQRDRYDLSRPNARPWLYGIATNLMGRHVRTEVRQLRVLERMGTDPVMEPFTERSDERISAGASGRALASALAALPRGHRDALLLVAWGDLSYAEAAQALDVRVGTVRSRINRARQKLRRHLGATDPVIYVSEEPVHE